MANYNYNYDELNKRKRKSKSFSFLSGFKYIIILGIICCFYSSESSVDNNVNKNDILLSVDSLELNNILVDLENELGISFDGKDKDSLYLVKSILSNDNLNDDDKNIFYGFCSIVQDCKYLDQENVSNTFKNIKVERISNEEKDSEKILGDYTFSSRKINIYVKTDSENKVITHEGIHALFTNNKSFKLPYYFREGMTELLSNEYYSDDPFYEMNIYPYQVAYIKMLCEMVGSDLVMETFCKGDFSLITNYMDLFNDTEYYAKDILEIFEDGFRCELEHTKSKFSNDSQENARSSLKKIYLNIYPNYDNYSSFEYNLDLASSVFEEDAEEFYFDYINYKGIFEKAYFSSNLKKEYPNSKLVNLNNRGKSLIKRKFLET